MSHVYFDHNATTQIDGRVLDAMLPWMRSQCGNPSSRHQFGRAAREAVAQAREQVARACGAQASQVVFTASGTEANNLAIKGLAGHITHGQILSSAVEHPCVTRSAAAMRALGHTSNSIPVDSDGKVDRAEMKAQLRLATSLVSVMLANNETGVLQDVAELAELARARGSLMHTDAVQALGKIALNFNDLNVHAMTVSSHKLHGPQGAAALILDKRVDIQPLLHGGGQERGLRSGTENVAAIVGFGLACELASQQLADYQGHTLSLRTQLETGLAAMNATIFGAQSTRLSNTSFFAVDGIEGETLVVALDRKGYAVASGSACSSDSTEPSAVLLAMGVQEDVARGAVRVSLGTQNSAQQVADFLQHLQQEILRLKQLSAMAA
ncbi:NifS Cysteine sulfinate desulfinase/cysteine desulfurase and related enzymes [Methylophilaceae bacterium]